MIKAVVFDLDDTLFPEEQFVISGFRAVDRWVVDHFSVTGFFTLSRELYHAGRRGDIFNEVLTKLSLTKDEELVSNLVTVYREHQPDIQLYEDARWALDYFRASVRLGMITDGYLVAQRNKVSALDIAGFFDVIVFSDEFGRANWKPSELPYREVMASLGCHGEECVYIGDNPIKDFVSAKKLGWSTIRICRGNGEYSRVPYEKDREADKVITSLFQLDGMIS